MAKEIDRVRAQGALSVIKQHPGMVLFVASPAIVALAAVWWLFGAGWAALLLVGMVLGGGAAVLMKRN
jgi:lipoprotein signal peptidase